MEGSSNVTIVFYFEIPRIAMPGYMSEKKISVYNTLSRLGLGVYPGKIEDYGDINSEIPVHVEMGTDKPLVNLRLIDDYMFEADYNICDHDTLFGWMKSNHFDENFAILTDVRAIDEENRTSIFDVDGIKSELVRYGIDLTKVHMGYLIHFGKKTE